MTSATSVPPIILVVEDDRDTRELYETIFQLEGFRVTDAADVDTALDEADHLQPDVVITDIGLPGGLDGVGLASSIHACPATAHVPVIAVTGRSLPEISRSAEFIEILQKPITPDELVAATRRVLVASAALRTRSQNARARVPQLLEKSRQLLQKSERLIEKRTTDRIPEQPD